MNRRKTTPPWKRPSRVAWFVLALVGSCWLIVHMPEDSRRMKGRAASVGESSEEAGDEKRAPAPGMAAASGAFSVAEEESDGILASLGGRRSGGYASAAPLAKGAGEGVNPASRVEQRADTSVAPSVKGAAEGGKPVRAMRQQRPDLEKILYRMQTFGKLFAIVGLAAFFGGLVEARRWHLALSKVTGRLTRMARLPEIASLALPTALCSNAVANSILVSSHAKGEIRTSALIAGGIANSYLAYVSHALRVMYPVIAAVGLPGILFYGIQFTAAFCMLLGVLLLNRWYVSGHGDTPFTGEAPDPVGGPLGWSRAFSGSAVRALSLLFRMTYMTVPLILGIEWLLKNGSLDFWGNSLPESVAALFPVELLSVAAAQMGGLVQSSALAAHLRADGVISNPQILLAMLVGSAMGNPVRMFRRNLPSALGIFPASIALTIVLGTQFSRFIATLIATVCVVAVMVTMGVQ